MSQSTRASAAGQPTTAKKPATSKAGPKPIAPQVIIDNVPAEMREQARWVGWRYTWTVNAKGQYKWTKCLFRARNPKVEASSTDPKTWASSDAAYQAYLDPKNKLDGIGFVFAADDPYGGWDFDNCIQDGEILPWARPYLENFKITYAEISPSGNGVKVFGRFVLPGGKGINRRGFGGKGTAVEGYTWGRFFTVTGNALTDVRTIEDISEPAVELVAALKARKTQKVTPTRSVEPVDLDDDKLLARARAAKNGAKFVQLYDRGDISDYPSPSEADYALVLLVAFWTGPDPARIERIVKRSALGQREKSAERSDYLATTIGNALNVATFRDPSYGRKAPKFSANGDHGGSERPQEPAGGDEPAKRPAIEIRTERHLVVKETIKALGADPDLFRRGELLVSVVQETSDEVKLTATTSMNGVLGSPRILNLSDAVISCHLTRNATFYQWRKDKSGEPIAVDAHPPGWLIDAVATQKHWAGIRPLTAVVECPFPRPDGSIVETPGYDARTATLYLPTRDFPKVPDHPTQSDAVAAWHRLKRYVRQFPFASEDDRIIFLVGLLNVIGRPAVTGAVPGIAVNGNKAGTGKGLFVDAMTMPGTGRPASTTGYPIDNIEAGKVKTSVVLSGKSVVSFDNLEEGTSYGGSAIDSALTALTIDERILGLSRTTGELPVRIAFFLNGNNISPSKDAWRRWLVANLITDLEYPDRRDDIEDKSLRSLILENRGEIVCDVLTILKAHALAGRPTAGWAPLGSFEDWDRVVRAAVWFATGLDCLATQRKTADDAPDRLAKIALLLGWRELPGGTEGGLTAAEAVALVESNPKLYETLRGVMVQRGRAGKPASSTSIGFALRGLKNTLIGGLKLKDTGVKRHGAVCWIVESTRPEDSKAKGEDGEDGRDDSSRFAPDLPSDHDVNTSTDRAKPSQNGTKASSPSSPSSPTQCKRESAPMTPAARLVDDARRLGVRLEFESDGQTFQQVDRPPTVSDRDWDALMFGLDEFADEVATLLASPANKDRLE